MADTHERGEAESMMQARRRAARAQTVQNRLVSQSVSRSISRSVSQSVSDFTVIGAS